jgi:carbamoyl-phosphate synthase large subunit
MLINTSFGIQSIADSYSLRRASLEHGVPYFTTVAGARAAIRGIKTILRGGLDVKSIQQYHKELL